MSAINIRKFHCTACKRPALIVCDKDEIMTNCLGCKKETKYILGVPPSIVTASNAARPEQNVIPTAPKPATSTITNKK